MKRIFRDFDRFTVYRIKQLLDDNKIPNFIKNEYVAGAIGEVSPLDAQPEVWLMDNEWETRAQQLIDEHVEQNASRQRDVDWQCSHCGETNEASFDLCWNCQTPAS